MLSVIIVCELFKVVLCECSIIESSTIRTLDSQLHLIVIILPSIFIFRQFKVFISVSTDCNGIYSPYPLDLLFIFKVGQALWTSWYFRTRSNLSYDVIRLFFLLTCSHTTEGEGYNQNGN